MAMLLAILVAFGRLSADSEMIGAPQLRAEPLPARPAGRHLRRPRDARDRRLSMYARPWGNRSLRTALFDIARTRASAGLKPQVFNDEFPGLVIYTEHDRHQDDRLDHVLISDERDPTSTTRSSPARGFMISDTETPDRHPPPARRHDPHDATHGGRADYQTDFESYDVNLDLRETLAGIARQAGRSEGADAAASSAQAHRAQAGGGRARRSAELVEYHRKFSIPFACIVFGLVGDAARHPARGARRSRGFALARRDLRLLHPAVAGQALAEQGACPPLSGSGCPTSSSALSASPSFDARAASSARPRRRVDLAALRSPAAARGERASRCTDGRSARCPPTSARHLSACEFLRAFALTAGVVAISSLIADFFDRFDNFLKHDAALGAILRSSSSASRSSSPR